MGKKKTKLQWLPAIFFTAWLLVWLLAELCASAVQPWFWTILAGAFLVVEISGAIALPKGDTLSELVWKIVEKEAARKALAGALAVALSIRAFSFTFLFRSGVWGEEYPEMYPAILHWLPWAVMSVGLAGWLIIHFTDRPNPKQPQSKTTGSGMTSTQTPSPKPSGTS